MKTIGLIVALLVTLASVAHAKTFLEPPPRFDRPYPGGTSVFFYPKSEMWDRCNVLVGKKLSIHPAECAKVRISKQTGKKRCFVFVAEHFKGTEDEDLLIRHGRAHCNGWWHIRRGGHSQ